MTKLLLFLAMQSAMPTPLPAEMESTIEPYSECVSAAFRQRIVAAEVSNKLEQSSGPKLMAQAIKDCSTQRLSAVDAAEAALANNPKFADADMRASFVQERFAFLDDAFVWSVSPEGDPDNWQ
ncbi:MAG: hypothetical protein ACEQR8_11275 [Cypionkella sp.]